MDDNEKKSELKDKVKKEETKNCKNDSYRKQKTMRNRETR